MQTFELDGVPVYRVDSDGGRSEQGLTVHFRVGTHDESYANAGVTALACRMIVASLPLELRDEVHVWWSGVFTHFGFHLDGNDASSVLRELSKAITNVHWDRLEQQQRLLQTGDEVVGLVGEAHLFHARYGAVGPGTAWTRKVAYTDASEAMVRQWLDQYFVASNCAVSLVGDAPASGSFTLPAGEPQDFLLLEALPQQLPARLELGADENFIGLQLTAPLTPTTHVAFLVLGDTLYRRLVHLGALTPELALEAQMVDANVGSFTALFAVHPDNTAAALEAVRETLSDFSEGLISSDLFERRAAEVRSSEPSGSWAVEQAAQERLFPALRSFQHRGLELAVLDTRAIAEVVDRAVRGTLLIASSTAGGEYISDLPLVSYPEPAPAQGPVRRMRFPLRCYAPRSFLAVDDSTITMGSRKERVSITYAQCEAVLDTGLSLTLISNTGAYLHFFPDGWQRGRALADEIRTRVPAERIVAVAPSPDERRAAEGITHSLSAIRGWRLLYPLALLVFLALNGWLAVVGTAAEQDAALLRLALVAAIFVGTFALARFRSRRR